MQINYLIYNQQKLNIVIKFTPDPCWHFRSLLWFTSYYIRQVYIIFIKIKFKFSTAVEVKSRGYLLFSPRSIIKCVDKRIKFSRDLVVNRWQTIFFRLMPVVVVDHIVNCYFKYPLANEVVKDSNATVRPSVTSLWTL